MNPKSLAIATILCCIALATGCGLHQQSPLYSSANAGGTAINNPLFVPVADREFVWNQIIDEMDNYFKIRREDRVRQVGSVLTEGTIETFPRVGSTYLEPWRRDSTPGFEKLHATLQSIRRRAEARVIPTEGGYLIELAVYKELEDVLQPELSTVGDTNLRHDTSPERVDQEEVLPPGTLGWIGVGRDVSLEQRILANIRGRVAELARQ